MELKQIKKLERECKKVFKPFYFNDSEILSLLLGKIHFNNFDLSPTYLVKLFKKTQFKNRYNELLYKEIKLQFSWFNSQLSENLQGKCIYLQDGKEKFVITKISKILMLDKHLSKYPFNAFVLDLDNLEDKLNLILTFQDENKYNIDFLIEASIKEKMELFCNNPDNFKKETNMKYVKNFIKDIEFFI